MTLQKAAAILSEISSTALGDAARSLAAERGTLRVMAMQGGPGRAPSPPKPMPVHVTPPAPAAAPATPPPQGWDAHRSTSMAAIDARVGRKPR